MQYYMLLLEQCGHKVVKVQATVTWLEEDQNDICVVTWLEYSFFNVRLFLLCNSVDSRSSKSCFVLDIELAKINVMKELGVLLTEKIGDTGFVVQTNTNPQNKHFVVQKCAQHCVEQWMLNYSEFPIFFPTVAPGKCFGEDQKNANFLAVWWIKRWRTCMILAARKIETLWTVKEKKKWWFSWVTHSDTRPCFTLWSKKKTNLFGNWAMQHSKS